MNYSQWIPYLIPVLLVQFGLMIFTLVDLVRHEQTNGPKWLWALVIVLFSFIGPIAYLIFGREE